MKKKYLIVLGGATASGKTALAIRLAKHFDCEILSSDSRQFYKKMDIGTAKPSPTELAAAKHHFIDFLEITQDYSIGDFEKDALFLLEKVFEKKDIAIMVGGSGMYMSALCDGLDDFPEVSAEIKQQLQHMYEKEGVESLQKMLQSLDNEYFEKVDIQNSHRLLRALGVCLASGKPYSFFKNQPKKERHFTPIYVCTDVPRADLYTKINQRVEQMLQNGLLKEVENLYPLKEKNALKTVGYQEFFDFIDKKTSYETAVELVKQHSRNYAKRQTTWFKHQGNYEFFSPEKTSEIIEFIEKRLDY